MERSARALRWLHPLAGVTPGETSRPPFLVTPTGLDMIVLLTGHLALVWNLSGHESDSRSRAEPHILPLRRDRDLHRPLSLKVRRQPSHEEEELADGPARRLHLLPEPIEVPPELGDPLVVLVLVSACPSPSRCPSSPSLASIRVSARLVGPSAGVGGFGSRRFGAFELGACFAEVPPVS